MTDSDCQPRAPTSADQGPTPPADPPFSPPVATATPFHHIPRRPAASSATQGEHAQFIERPEWAEVTEEVKVDFATIVEAAGKTVDLVGVSVIVLGALLATALFAGQVLRRRPAQDAYRRYRQTLGRAVLLGLEFLVAGDIIRTVAISPTFQSVGVLAAIVAVRTFLSFSLEAELEGHLPWRPRPTPHSTTGANP